jgi:hypothetical protein
MNKNHEKGSADRKADDENTTPNKGKAEKNDSKDGSVLSEINDSPKKDTK